MSTIYTIGYQNRSLESFIHQLERNGIDVLVDARERPVSRKKGFSRSELVKNLEGRGIKYIHLRELGSPKELRTKFQRDGDFAYFERQYRALFPAREQHLKYLSGLKGENICLMCFEADHRSCHRSILADEIVSLDRPGADLIHL